MFVLNRLSKYLCRKCFTTPVRNCTVSVIGGASDIGQTLCMMLRAQPTVSKLIVYDKSESTNGVLMDLSHIPTDACLKGYIGEETLDRALKEADLVLAVGAVPDGRTMSKTKCTSKNMDMVKSIAYKLSKLNTMPMVGISADPLNVLVPMASEILKQHSGHDPKKLFGITTIDSLRAQSLYAYYNQWSPRECMVPVIGGHSRDSTIPLLSQAKPYCDLNGKALHELVAKIRRCEESVRDVKRGRTPTLSMAYSILMFARGILGALGGGVSKVNAFVENNDFGTGYFGGLVAVDDKGAIEMQRYSHLSQLECHLLERSIEAIRKDVLKGKSVLELA
ncbi:malate dehydrogenase-like [Plodia interpunctella]|uniref:malate dehydrogenase-like n=1 Tax=Plodia interpunctella TaxID=58824 RepID=UPI0023688A52|nr:malate dehydrogenase-like [Plodia interpunctella]